ncbi:MAG: ornithine carbamoyltransferase, partial [Verrucomicrobiae bacterium]|nr:ornithine carbamoyltransferase [Verrucomicrobiae bacterium]
LKGETWAMIFTKSSTRTRVSFEVGLTELGARSLFLNANDIQLGRGEPIKDTARVLGRMVHGAIIRTFDQQDVVDFAEYGQIPTINALTDEEHPCQILADLLTIRERLGGWEEKKVAFFGDGDCNMGRSWAWAAKHLGFELVIAAPAAFQPDAAFLERLGEAPVILTEDVEFAASGADVLYTDT